MTSFMVPRYLIDFRPRKNPEQLRAWWPAPFKCYFNKWRHHVFMTQFPNLTLLFHRCTCPVVKRPRRNERKGPACPNPACSSPDCAAAKQPQQKLTRWVLLCKVMLCAVFYYRSILSFFSSLFLIIQLYLQGGSHTGCQHPQRYLWLSWEEVPGSVEGPAPHLESFTRHRH